MAKHTGRKQTAGNLSHEKFYEVYCRIRRRITNPKSKDFARYGGRGLIFDWQDYPSFRKDMYESYLEHKKNNTSTTIERLNNDIGYTKENCRWATWEEQAKNKRTSRYITYNGKTLIVADWARIIGTSRQAIRYRLEQGWKVEDIIKMPFLHSNRYGKKD